MKTKATHLNSGSWAHRLLVYSFTTLFGLLLFFLLGFVMRDIGTWPGPAYTDIEARLGDQALSREATAIQTQIEEATRSIEGRKQRQTVLRDSTSNSEKTMNQLLELQRLSLQNGVARSEEENQALAESQRLFLANQAKYQEMNDQISTLGLELSELHDRQRAVQKSIGQKTPAIQREFQSANSRHQLKVAAAKLAVLVPLLALSVWLLAKKGVSLYSPLIYGFGFAVFAKVGLVMHEHFPTRMFKYILILASIGVVVKLLIYQLRSKAYPKLEWLLKQYRDAYEHFLCPCCEHSIRRGSLKNLFWTRRSLKKLRVPDHLEAGPDEPYVCPVCTTSLFEECPSCKRIRHSLLPACTHCGASKSLLPES